MPERGPGLLPEGRRFPLPAYRSKHCPSDEAASAADRGGSSSGNQTVKGKQTPRRGYRSAGRFPL